MSQKESEWKRQLNEILKEHWLKNTCEEHDLDVIELFISNLLSNREKEIAEEVEKLVAVYGYKFTEDDGRSMLDMCDGYNEAIKDVLQILKH